MTPLPDTRDPGDASALWIGTSWKMNKTLAEAEAFARALRAADDPCDDWNDDRRDGSGASSGEVRIQRFVIPPLTAAREVARLLADTSVLVGAQNMHWDDAGAWTGEVSAPMLIDCGLDLVELGHSERREHFAETDERVGLKVEAAVRHGLVPLICIGESLDEREGGRARKVLEHQVRAAFGALDAGQRHAPVLLAYEPVWAIGEHGIPASADYADERHADVKAIARETLGRTVPCLYGGSVDAGNCRELVRRPHVDGLFIGRAAWDAAGYLDILRRCGSGTAGSPKSDT